MLEKSLDQQPIWGSRYRWENRKFSFLLRKEPGLLIKNGNGLKCRERVASF